MQDEDECNLTSLNWAALKALNLRYNFPVSGFSRYFWVTKQKISLQFRISVSQNTCLELQKAVVLLEA